MKRSRVLHATLVLTLFAMTGLAASCSKDDSQPATAPVTDPFESGTLNSGNVFVHRFNIAGSFGYRCRFHNGMGGTVTVAAAGSDSVLIQISDNAFGAPTGGTSFPLKTGGYVKWTHGGTNPHSVTRP